MLRKRKLASCSSPDNKKRLRECEDDEVTLKVPEPEVRRSPNGYILPPPLPSGFKIKDNCKQTWILSSSIGIGGFGEIYSASSESNPKKKDYVIKVEPHTNGPLYVEINFYSRCAKSTQSSELNRAHLGIPEFIGSGSFSYLGQKFRFLVLPRLGEDLERMSNFCNGYFSTKTACNIAVQVIDCLEYIHSCGFVHKDIKGSNLLLHRKNKNKLYLADFGLASRFIHDGIHKPQSENPRMAHEGTLEYTSRDGHLGCFSRRGDMEVLFYNLIEWIGGCLPWDAPELKKPNFYKEAKFEAFRNPLDFLNSCFGADGYPDFLFKYLEYLNRLQFSEAPDYDYLRRLLKVSPGSSKSLSFVKMPRKSIVTFKNSSNQENVQPNFQSKCRTEVVSLPPKQNPPNYSLFRVENSVQYLEDRKRRTESLLQSSWNNPTPVMLEVIAMIKARQKRPKTSRRSFIRSHVSKFWNSSEPNDRKRVRTSTSSMKIPTFKFDAREALNLNRELMNLKCNLANSKRVTTRNHSSPHTISMTPRSLRKQVRDALDIGLGNIAQFLKSLYPFRMEKA